MAVTCLQIIKITEGTNGATVLHLEDGTGCVQSPAWIAKHAPEVGCYLIDNGAKHGEQWVAKNSLRTLPAVLVEVQRVAVNPGDLVLFKVPREFSGQDAANLARFMRAAAPSLPFLITQQGVEVVVLAPASAAPVEGSPA